MNKEITIYELLGLIKDGQAPKGFKYSGYEWIYNYESSAYWNGKGVEFEDYMENSLIDCLNEKVEIIEANNKIEKLDNRYYDEINQCYGGLVKLDQNILVNKINELIDEVNALKENNEN